MKGKGAALTRVLPTPAGTLVSKRVLLEPVKAMLQKSGEVLYSTF
jgi:hypothetical protein